MNLFVISCPNCFDVFTIKNNQFLFSIETIETTKMTMQSLNCLWRMCHITNTSSPIIILLFKFLGDKLSYPVDYFNQKVLSQEDGIISLLDLWVAWRKNPGNFN